MRRGDLDVFGIAPAVRPFVFETKIREVHMPVEERKVMLERPPFDFTTVAVRPAVGVGMLAISFVKELLVLSLELVLEGDAVDAYVVLGQALGRPYVGAIHLRVMRELACPHGTRVEQLPRLVIASPMTLEELPTPVSQRDDDGSPLVFAIEGGDRANQAIRSQAIEVPVPEVAGPSALVAKIVDRDHAKGSDRRQRPYL
jgi:hypothetical protein